MIAFVKLLPGFLLVLAAGIHSSLADVATSDSIDLSRFQLAQNYSDSDAATPDTASKSPKHSDHDDHPLFIYSYEISVADDEKSATGGLIFFSRRCQCQCEIKGQGEHAAG